MRIESLSIQLEDFVAIRDMIDRGEIAGAEQSMTSLTGKERMGAQVLQVRILNHGAKWTEAYLMGKLVVDQAIEAGHPIWKVYARAEWVVSMWELGKLEEMVENIRQAESIIDGMSRDEKHPILFPLGQLNLFMGKYYMRKGMLETGVRYFRKSFFAYRNGREESLSAITLSMIGQAYFAEGMFDGALLHQYEALNLFERFGTKTEIAKEWALVAQTHGAMFNYNRAIEAAERSLRFFREAGSEMEMDQAREFLAKFQELQEARNSF